MLGFVLLVLYSGYSLAELFQVPNGVATLKVQETITAKQAFFIEVFLEQYWESEGTMVTLTSNETLYGEVALMTNSKGYAKFNLWFANTGTFEITASAINYTGKVTATSFPAILTFSEISLVIHK